MYLLDGSEYVTGWIDIASLLGGLYPEVDPIDFYRDVFPIGSFETKGKQITGGYNGIIIELMGKRKPYSYIVTDDHDCIADVLSRDNFCMMAPISYVGRHRTNNNARYMHAMTIDLDGVESQKNFNFLIEQIENGINMTAYVWGLPRPTYIVASGTGIHLYYVFENPIRLWPNVQYELVKLKKRLTWQAWTQGASVDVNNVQYESLFQAFRMVGSVTKVATRVRAFKCGEKVSVQYLNQFVPEEHQADNFDYVSRIPLEEAKEKWPEWHDRIVVKKGRKKTWTNKRALYDWWRRELRAGAVQGVRYNCVMVMAIYAVKCGIPYDELKRDAFELIDFLNTRGDEFTENDVMDALEAYKESYKTYPIRAIIARTNITIKKNTRNGRTQWEHLQAPEWIDQNGKRKVNTCRDNRLKNLSGRPKGSGEKKQEVYGWRQVHPDGNKSQCAKETGLSRTTVIKWWDWNPGDN